MASSKNKPRFRKLRVRAFDMGVEIQELAEMAGYHRVYVSRLLSGAAASEPGLDKIEGILDEIEREDNHAPSHA